MNYVLYFTKKMNYILYKFIDGIIDDATFKYINVLSYNLKFGVARI